MKLNLGCGFSKLPGFINVDIDPDLNPDLVVDILKPFPWEPNSVEQIVLYHTIEHIKEDQHLSLFARIYEVLCVGGLFVLAYPEFERCATNWLINHRGKREFWKHTIYGRQLSPYDYHIALMNTPELLETLESIGFKCEARPDEQAPYNTVLKATKGTPLPTYEDVVRTDIFGV